SATRLFAAAEWNDVVLSDGGLGPPPPPASERRFLFLGAGLEREGRRWVKVRSFDQMDRDEDFNLGASGFLELAGSPRILGAAQAARVRGAGSVGLPHARGFALAAAAGET